MFLKLSRSRNITATGVRAALRQRERVLHAVAEQIAVGEQRQRIVEGELAQLLLERLALADVAEIERQSLHRRIVRQVAADALDHVALRRRARCAARPARRYRRVSPPPRARNARSFSPSSPAHRSGSTLPATSSGLSPSVRSEAGEAKRSHTVHGHDHDDVGGVGDQRGVALLDHARGAPLAHQRVTAQHDALAHHEQQRQGEHDHGHHVRRAARRRRGSGTPARGTPPASRRRAASAPARRRFARRRGARRRHRT